MIAPYIVGIGASAGGLAAIEEFFDHTPKTDELIFIIAQHLSPDFVSLMSNILVHHTNMPIITVKNKMELNQGAIYLIPPSFEAEIKNNQFKLKKLALGAQSLPINTLFKSLARAYSRFAIGIIFSGTGSDGTLGMVEIARNQGLTIVQDPVEAKFADMPEASIATEEIHCILPVAEISDVILEYIHQPVVFNKNRKQIDPLRKAGYGEIFHLLNLKYNINFSLYKLSSMSRRIQRRMQLLNIKNLYAYVDYLTNNKEGLKTLYQDLLIGVTEFFRDPEAFTAIETSVIPALFTKFIKTQKEIRIWISSCSTGEEAYSIAILFKKYSDEHNMPFSVKIFATDVSNDYIKEAKKGVYSYKSVAKLHPDILNKYFIKYTRYYQIIPEIRSKILFAPHSLLRDPPFTAMDLICCRNLLIYIKTKEQEHITNLLRFSLNIGGFLFLGPSEGISSLEPELIINNQKWRIFEKTKHSIYYPMKPALQVVEPLISDLNDTPASLLPLYVCNAIIQDVVYSGFIVDAAYVVLHSVGNAREIIVLPEGPSTLILPKIIINDLKSALISALHKAKDTLMPIVCDQITIHHGKQEIIKMSVHPIIDANRETTHYWVRMDSVKATLKKSKKTVLYSPQNDTIKDETIITLQEELLTSRSLLLSSVRAKDQITEELQSTNEELMASNQELQSSNEELRAVNDELYEVNKERLEKVEEISRAKTDIDNLIRSAEICTIILNNKLEIYMFTPSIKQIFELVDHDVGRPLEIFKHNLKLVYLIDTIKNVLKDNTAYESEVINKKNHWYFLKITPYLANHKKIPTGIVITLTDIHETKLLQQKKLEMEEDLRMALKTGLIGIWSWNLKTNDLTYDETLMKILGLNSLTSLTKAQQFMETIHLNDRKNIEKAFSKTISKYECFEQKFRIIRPNGAVRYLSCSANIHRGLSVNEPYITGVCWDMTEQYWLEERIIDSKQLNVGLDAITDGWWDWDLITHETYLSPLLKKTLGFNDSELPNRIESYQQLMLPEDLKKWTRTIEMYTANNITDPTIQELRVKHKNNQIVWLLSRTKGIANGDDKLVRIIGTATNITTLKETERALKKLAYHDSLTKISNKHVFLEAISRAIARAERNSIIFAVMFIDVDDFKIINDKWGHSVGDAVLCEVTNRISNFSRVIDLLARVGGDEFGILLEDITTAEEINDIAGRYISAFSTPFIVNDTAIVVTISIGVALYPEHGNTVLKLLTNADRNMYLAKKNGKNQFLLSDRG